MFNLKNIRNYFFRYGGANAHIRLTGISVEAMTDAHFFTEKTKYRICITPDLFADTGMRT
jgi:hypothetical protein